MMGSVARFFNSFIGIAPFEKRSTANVLGQKYYTIIRSAASWLDFLVHFYDLPLRRNVMINYPST